MRKILFTALIVFILCGCSRGAENQEKENESINGINHYNILFQNQYGGLLKNKKISIEKVRDNLLMNFGEGFSNINLLQTDSGAILFDVQENITADEIIKALKKNKEQYSQKEKYNLLIIPLAWPTENNKDISLGKFSTFQIKILETYAEVFEKNNIQVDFVQILGGFNQRMQAEFNFALDESLDFVEVYAARTRKLFPDAKIIISVGEMLCYNEYALQASDQRCSGDLKSGKFINQWDFIEKINNKNVSYEIVGYKYFPALDHSSLFIDFEKMFDDLIGTGKKIYIEEFFIPGAEPMAGFIKNKPDNGWSQDYRAKSLSRVLKYINHHPDVVGINYLEKDGVGDWEDFDYKLINKEKNKNLGFLVVEDWYKSLDLEAETKTDEDGRLIMPVRPGLYEFKLNWRTKRIVDLGDNSNITIKFE